MADVKTSDYRDRYKAELLDHYPEKPEMATTIPGLKSSHQIVSPKCRENRGRFIAAEEAAGRLVRDYAKYSDGDQAKGVNWHFVLVREEGI